MILIDPIALRVRAVEPLARTLKRIIFEAADGGLLPSPLPGAHLPIALPASEALLRNAYSLTGPPGDRSRYEIVVRRTERSRGGSAFIHEVLKPGDVLEAVRPNSLFPLQNRARKHLLIAGGIGITPFLSFLPVLAQRRERFEFHLFARRDEIPVFQALLAAHAGHNIHIHAARDAMSIPGLLALQPLGTHVYTCGPASLMDGVRETALALGWPKGRIHVESFGAIGGTPFRVRLARSGGEIAVGESESMLEALERAGAPIRSLCRGGACGECMTRVLAGTPEHRDHFLSEAEKADGMLVMPCVSRALTPTLTLDL